LSETVDQQRREERDPERWRRVLTVSTNLGIIAKLKLQGLSMNAIARHLGWSPDTLYAWVKASELVSRKAIRMTKSNTTP